MAQEIDRALLEKAVDLSASAVRGAMGAENSQPPKFAADVFREVWKALKEAVQDIPDKTKAGF